MHYYAESIKFDASQYELFGENVVEYEIGGLEEAMDKAQTDHEKAEDHQDCQSSGKYKVRICALNGEAWTFSYLICIQTQGKYAAFSSSINDLATSFTRVSKDFLEKSFFFNQILQIAVTIGWAFAAVFQLNGVSEPRRDERRVSSSSSSSMEMSE